MHVATKTKVGINRKKKRAIFKTVRGKSIAESYYVVVENALSEHDDEIREFNNIHKEDGIIFDSIVATTTTHTTYYDINLDKQLHCYSVVSTVKAWQELHDE